MQPCCELARRINAILADRVTGEPLVLARVRSQDGRGEPRGRARFQHRWVHSDRVQRVGVDHERNIGFRDDAPNRGLGARLAAEAGPDRQRAEAPQVLQHLVGRVFFERTIGCRGQRAGDQLASRHRGSRFSSGHRAHDHARPRAQRGAAREHGRADHAVGAAHDEAARRPLVGLGARFRQHEIGDVEHDEARAGHHDVDADVDDVDAPGVRATGLEQQPRLVGGEADRLVGAHGRAVDRAGGAVDARRDVDGQHRHARYQHLLRDHRAGAGELPAEPGAVHRVDHEVGAAEHAAELGDVEAVLERALVDANAARPQHPPGHAPVGAVVALARHDRDAATVRAAEHAQRVVRNRAAGPLDEHFFGRALLDRVPIGSRHLRRRQHDPHAAPLTASSDRPVARPVR